jgi:hypothetical protein
MISSSPHRVRRFAMRRVLLKSRTLRRPMMPRPKKILATDLTIADLKRLLVQKEQVEPLQEKRAKLEAELASVNAQLAKLGGSSARRGRKPGKMLGRKPGRPVAKKAGRPAGKKVVRRAAKKAKAAPKRPAPTIESIVVQVLRKNRKPMAFQDLLSTIKKGKLVKTKSKDFANVLRRVLSTSTRVKRVGRGVYGVKG